jgi:hypothetical protein
MLNNVKLDRKLMNGKGAVAIFVCFVELTLRLFVETEEGANTLVTIVENAIEIAAPYVCNISVPPVYSVFRFSITHIAS